MDAHEPPVPMPDEEPSLDLDDQFCFTLYAASRAVTAAYRPLLESVGLTYPQYLVMLVLWQRERATVKELITALHLDYGTATPLIKRLESHGLVERTRRADDERVVEVVLTGEGADMRRRIMTVPPSIGKAMGFSPEEYEAAQLLLRRLRANLERGAAGHDAGGVPQLG
ncbi:MarR family transcriptional regulator [Streptomyces sp. NPDC006923]|uniref:MarR family winged helix-turn-helix transcriptional regulator n=1 Tax=Streptomyces sp. NPDC006923 TaxID=3155355 RepID=UPI0033EA084E